MKYASLKYDYSDNLGDQIQSLAAEQFLPNIDKKFDRDTLKNVSEKDKYMIILNGWFSHSPKSCLPPSDSILPIFYGFHITDSNGTAKYFLSGKNIAYFKQHEPVGCRDKRTMELLANKGIKAFYSKCLTLTFPKRKREPENGKVFIVDADQIPIPKRIRKKAIKITHLVSGFYGEEIKYLIAKKLLELYRDKARLIITTRLHCALPCVAMGIPVIFFGDPDDYRVSILKDINIKIYKYNNFEKKLFGYLSKKRTIAHLWMFLKKIDWNPKPVSVEGEKRQLITKVHELIRNKIEEK